MNRLNANISNPHLFMGLIFITAGVVILLDNVGISLVDSYWQYWPLVLVIIGVTRLAGSMRHPRKEEG